MRLHEIKPIAIKPLTPQQQRVKSLQIQKDNASKALKAERDRQRIEKAHQNIANIKLV